MDKYLLNSAIFFTLLLCISVSSIHAQSKDTILNMVLSKPHFYNVINGTNGKVYAGTSEGIVEVEGTLIRQNGSQIGYITTDKAGLPKIDSNGIGNYKEKKFSHLLPYPELAREEYHAVSGNLFYLCSGGRLYIFDLVMFDYGYPNHSFRSISKDLVGTYSGIYLKGKKLAPPIPNFTDGYIRQFGDRAFICNYNLTVLEKEALETGVLVDGKNYFSYQLASPEVFNDIFPSLDKAFYYIASGHGLIRTNTSFTADTVIYATKNAPFWNILITENPYCLYFTLKNKLLSYAYSNGQVKEVCATEEPILGGVFSDNQLYLITSNGLYRSNSTKQLQKLMDIEKSHSILKMNGSELLISTDNGLYLFNLVSRSLSAVIKGVEFNRQALHKEGELIYAGSANGLYTINTKDLPILIQQNKAEFKRALFDDNIKKAILLMSLFAIALIGLLVRFRNKLKNAEKTIETLQKPQETINKEKIEQYIAEHLSTVSIKTLVEHFSINGPALYEILKPNRPGHLIQQLRLSTLKKMRHDGNSLDEISEATGFSVSYLKKLKG